MISAAPGFPGIDGPDGWVQSTKGPRIWIVPPDGGGRIVVAPLQGHSSAASLETFVEHVLDQERSQFPRLKQAPPVAVTSVQSWPGLVIDVAAFASATDAEPSEWRTYVVYGSPALFAVLFLQSKPDRFAVLRPVFLEVASRVTVPDSGDRPAPERYHASEAL